MKEICICAAVKTTEGEIIRGHRHHNCFEAMHGMGLTKHDSAEQGFVTSLNRFVGREEGLKLQIAAGIKSADPSGKYGQELFSEDLY